MKVKFSHLLVGQAFKHNDINYVKGTHNRGLSVEKKEWRNFRRSKIVETEEEYFNE